MDWELFDGKQIQGPFTEESLLASIRSGLPGTLMVRRVGETEWMSMRAHAPFAYALEQSAGATTAPRAPPTPIYMPQPIVVKSESGCLRALGLITLGIIVTFIGCVIVTNIG